MNAAAEIVRYEGIASVNVARVLDAIGRPAIAISMTSANRSYVSACADSASCSPTEGDSKDLGSTGSTAVVTGGSKGIGLAIATTFAEEAAKVAVMARGAEALDEAVAKLRDAGAPDAVGISVDMSDAESIAAGFETVAQRWGELNSLVHTIGPGDGYFEDMEDAQWEETFALGTMSGVRSIRAALPMLRAAEWGRVVTLSAHSIQRQNPRIVAYTASKAVPISSDQRLT